MGKNMTGYFIDGTAALKPERCPKAASDATFVAFRGSSQRRSSHQARHALHESYSDRAARSFRDVVERSEMACSLLTEDLRGVAYGTFTKANIATLSIACSVIGILSIVFGA